MSGRPRVIFFGTPRFAVPILRATARIADITAVVTKPDQEGRHGPIRSAIATTASELGLTVMMPSRLDPAFTESFAALAPDVAVLAAYGLIVPKNILAIPERGFVNVHPSLLPKYRGAAPVTGAILDSAETTGTTLIVLDEQVDHGPIIAQESLRIEPREHRPTLEQRLADLGASLIQTTLLPYLSGELTPHAQEHHRATYTRTLSREAAQINWTDDAARIERDIRAYDPWPGTVTMFDGAPLKILDGYAERYRESRREKPGSVILMNDLPAVVCGVDVLVLTKLQAANGKPMDARAFTRGHRTFVGSTLHS